jgi:PAS domain S-box-containing protein
LVVDDERVITMYLEELLTNFGYDVVGLASNGAEAIEMARKFVPDLILMDIIMPGERNGIDAANEIKDELDIPIIFLTAFADDKIVEKAKYSAPFNYIVKPFQAQEIKVAIEIAVYKKEIENKLKESEEKYRTLVEESRDGIGIIQNGVFKYANPALLEMLDKPEDIANHPFINYFHEECRANAEDTFYQYLKNEDAGPINEFMLAWRDGSCLPIETNAKLMSFNGKPAVLTFFRNMAERRHTKCVLDYLVNDINESNQLIIPKIEELINDPKRNKQNKQLKLILSLLMNNANRIRKFYKFLQVKYDPDELQPFDLLDKINSAINVVTKQFPEREIKINTHIGGAIPTIDADDFIEDIFQLLFENSVEYSEENPVIIDVKVNTEYVKETKYVNIRIEDHSLGINDSDKKNILEQEISSDNGNGKELGISIVKSVMNRYSGFINIEDRVKGDYTKGCVFVLKLPVIK